MTRRDKVFLTGKRAGLLNPHQGAHAWETLAVQLQSLGELPLPKFKHLLRAIRLATIQAASTQT